MIKIIKSNVLDKHEYYIMIVKFCFDVNIYIKDNRLLKYY